MAQESQSLSADNASHLFTGGLQQSGSNFLTDQPAPASSEIDRRVSVPQLMQQAAAIE